MQVAVDDDVCGGHGTCVSLCPEVFALTDDGYAVVRVDPVPPEHRATVREARTRCPTRAITVVEDE